MRLGSYYRACVMERLGFLPRGETVLEVGAYDGYLLSRCGARLKVGIDTEPAASRATYASMVRADGRRPPFRDRSFDTIFLMDVAEHEEDDKGLLCSTVAMLKPGGVLYTSVPSSGFTAFPPFVTPLLHRRWGHIRPGYTPEEFFALLPPSVNATLTQWNEPLFRLLYLPGRALWGLFPPAGRLLMRLCAWLDGYFPRGLSGHLYLRMENVPAKAPERSYVKHQESPQHGSKTPGR